MLKQISSKKIIAIALIIFSTIKISQAQQGQPSKMDYVLQLLQYAYVDTVDSKKLNDDAVTAMIKSLDPHSVYIPAEELKETNEPLVGKFEGIGIQFNIHEDTIMVTNVISGGPSQKIGLHASDRIVKIDGQNVAGIKITNKDVLKKLRGDKGTKVNVGILRRDEKDLLDFTITRDKIPLFSVDATYMINAETGYIKVARFADQTADEVRESIKKLQALGMKNLVLDLCDNGGGYLNRAVDIADEFLTADKMIVYTKGRTSPQQNYKSTNIGNFEKGKLIVMIDEYSASASEIVSGAVQDWDRALLVGRRSFGKGLVQNSYPLPDGSAVRLTIAHYYTPSGRCIQKPYEKGDEEDYESDISNRFKHGELSYKDSIHFSDSLKFETSNKRTVYGGGGIMPDVFVPIDTSMFSKYYSSLQRKGLLNDFPLTYVDRNRDALLKTYPDINVFKKNFTVDQKLMDEFFAAAEKKDVPKDTAGLKISETLLKTNLKAIIANNLWNTGAYYEIANDLNPIYVKAVEAMQSDLFQKMKIAVK